MARNTCADSQGDDGFTLIELMVVVLIIAILLAIAIPTFLGARNSANARAAQSNLRNAITAEETFYTNNQSFSAVTSDMTAVEPNLVWSTSPPATKGGSTVGVATYTSTGALDSASTPDKGDGAVIVEAYSVDGHCYGIMRVDSATTGVNVGTYYSEATAGCSTSWPATVPSGSTTGKASTPANIGNGWFASF
jgi:type IV pilus assembly protein PilA